MPIWPRISLLTYMKKNSTSVNKELCNKNNVPCTHRLFKKSTLNYNSDSQYFLMMTIHQEFVEKNFE